MDPLTGGLIAGGTALGQIGAGIIGSRNQRKMLQKALDFQLAQINASVAELQKVGIPPIEAQKLILQMPELAGLETIPEELKTAFEYEVDPQLEQVPRTALAKLAEFEKTGYTPEEIAQKYSLLREGSDLARASQERALQDAAERGMAGSGAELAAQIAGSQAGADRLSQAMMDLGGQASQRALQAIQGRSDMAMQLRGQELAEASAGAQAEDVMCKFNIQMSYN
jgi:hypothetical protein